LIKSIRIGSKKKKEIGLDQRSDRPTWIVVG